jgi:hypothetical protein
MTESSTERRRFHRFATDKPVVIRSGDEEHRGTTLDVSLRGLLLDAGEGWEAQPGSLVHASIRLDDGTSCIDIDGEVCHVEGSRIGIHVTMIDLDSASLLRRMVELNLADHTLLERNLAQLISA